MTRSLTLGAALLLMVGVSVPAHALDMTLAAGVTSQSTEVVRLGLESNFQRSWWQSSTGRLTGYWDGAYTYWHGENRVDNHSLSFSPVFVYEFAGATVRPYIEAGIGVAAFANTRVEDRRLSSAYQFEDRIGFGLRFAGQEIGLRAIHYSNFELKQPNDGIETFTLHYRVAL